MAELASILAFGFWLGVRHATDADHVVAVSTIVARTKKIGTAWLLGAFWGLGHTLTILIVGAAIISFKVSIAPRLELALEFAVGILLIILGLLNMAGYRLSSLGIKRHSHAHDHTDPEHHHELLGQSHDGHAHAHAHVSEPELGWLKRNLRDAGTFQLLRSAAVGLIHGLAGSAAVALLVLAAIPNPKAAIFYLLLFGIGTLAGMLTLSALMELAMLHLTRWWKTAERTLTFMTGLISFILGARIACQNALNAGFF